MARLLFVNLQGKMGGAEVSLVLMVKNLRNQFLINVACPNEGPLSTALASVGIDCFGLPRPPESIHSSVYGLLYWLRTSLRTVRIVLKARPDIIHANSFYAGAVSILACLVSRRKLVLHARDLTDFGLLSKLYGRLCGRIIAVSHAVRNELVKQGINPSKMSVVYNGVDGFAEDRPESSAQPEAVEENRLERPFVFAQVAQFVPWKNHFLFLKAASQVAPGLPNARFLLVGDDVFGRDGAYKSCLLDFAERSPVRDKVSFLGWQKNMQQVWANIDCLVHPVRREPFGRVIIEAMAHKVPVIAVQACGPAEIIRNGDTGILVQGGDAHGLSEAMIKIAGDSELADRLAAAGYEYVMSSFTADKTAAHVRRIYEQVLAG